MRGYGLGGEMKQLREIVFAREGQHDNVHIPVNLGTLRKAVAQMTINQLVEQAHTNAVARPSCAPSP